MNARLSAVLDLIDAANSQDPNRVAFENGVIGKEVLYGRRMSEALSQLEPDASEALQIAVRAQHLERWAISRDAYPRDRAGYLKWRGELSRLHAARAVELMQSAGYEDEALMARVSAIIQKKRLGQDPESQTLEDCACLVFLAHHFEEFTREHARDKVIEIVRKTWNKMSDRGRSAALGLRLSEMGAELVKEALGAP